MATLQATKNRFIGPIDRSLDNCVNIFTFTRNQLFNNQGIDLGIASLLGEVDPMLNNLNLFRSIKGSAQVWQHAEVEAKDNEMAGLPAFLDHIDDETRPVFGKGTLGWNKIWVGIREVIEQGGEQSRLNGLLILKTSLAATPALVPVSLEVQAKYDAIQAQILMKSGYFNTIQGNRISIASLKTLIAKQMDRTLGWLKFYYAMEDNAEDLVNGFLAVDLLQTHPADGLYEFDMSVNSFEEICQHLTKPGEMLEITVVGSDIQIGINFTGKEPAPIFTTFTAGPPVLFDPHEGMGDVTQKHFMARVTSLTVSSHLKFQIIKPD